ncbi:peroxide stress protein YaaA [Phytohalomonas tamaricis]|uniref:peroxide stress protein YaaA n=1 Tax=Phytohalomonas tamaricis TaxID=2081032 RepID=UPI000D0AE00E|nr:peroxide stress protein YaaA [Phytohalomonas tamaricis]
MLSVISPAKTLDFDTPPTTDIHTQPDYLDQSQQLIEILRQYSPQALAELMSLSDKLAGLNAARFKQWQPSFDLDNAKQAVQAFQGDVYVGLEADKWNQEELQWSQQHLRILSGLYGLLRPLDLIQPYRLEMGTRLPNTAGSDLYAFWKKTLTEAVKQAVEESGSPVLVNLASNEYFKVIDAKRFPHRIVTPVFKDAKNGQYKIVSFYAKKARGWMSAWMIRERLERPEGLKEFDVNGYRFNAAMSEGDTWVFTREEQ